MFVTSCVNGADGHLICRTAASDVEDIAKRLKGTRNGTPGSVGQPYDFLSPGKQATDPDETIHKAVNDTAWWLK